MDEVIEFIYKRFKNEYLYDSKWLTGNCYYFAVILKARFPEGEIYYDTTWGHFVLKYNNQYYDWQGISNFPDANYVSWEKFDEYDSLLKQRIIRDCII